jgi:hypothetical protein
MNSMTPWLTMMHPDDTARQPPAGTATVESPFVLCHNSISDAPVGDVKTTVSPFVTWDHDSMVETRV